MGYFYSKAKYASITNNKSDYKKYNALSMIVPIITHGIYDAIVLGATATEEVLLAGLSLLLWIAYVVVMFILAFITVLKSAKNDFCIVTLPGSVQTIYNPAFLGTWTCGCGTVNQLNFCSKCGSQRPFVDTWTCPGCGTVSAFKFCGRCGCPRPQVQPQMMPGQPAPQQMYQQPAPQQMSPQQTYQQSVPQHMSSQQMYQQPVPQHMSSQQTYQQPMPQQMPPQQYGQMPQQGQPQIQPQAPQQPGQMPPNGMM